MQNPKYGNIHLDANALEPPEPKDNHLVAEFQRVKHEQTLSVVNPYGVQQEVDDPRTPTGTKDDMAGIYTIQTGLTSEEETIRAKLRDLLQGNAASGRHDADANHIFEAQKYGGGYFVTHDKRLLARKDKIANLIGPELRIVALRQFMDICNNCGLL